MQEMNRVRRRQAINRVGQQACPAAVVVHVYQAALEKEVGIQPSFHGNAHDPKISAVQLLEVCIARKSDAQGLSNVIWPEIDTIPHFAS
jgi:hypothetical protein